MTSMAQIAVAGSIDEAEELRVLLETAGINAVIEPATEHDPQATADGPQKVLVPEQNVDEALDAIEALTEPDELVGD
jgi:hypothetical protein